MVLKTFHFEHNVSLAPIDSRCQKVGLKLFLGAGRVKTVNLNLLLSTFFCSIIFHLVFVLENPTDGLSLCSAILSLTGTMVGHEYGHSSLS